VGRWLVVGGAISFWFSFLMECLFLFGKIDLVARVRLVYEITARSAPRAPVSNINRKCGFQGCLSINRLA
jgi:hypothetical protein